MKKVLMSLLIMFLCFGFVSAAYECSDGNDFDSESREISENNEREINGIGIALTDSSESGVLNKITANIIVDAKKITLSNETTTEDVNLLTGEYTVEFINISGSEARLKVEGDTENVEEEDLTTVDETQVYITSIDSGNNEIDLIVGIETMSLSNTDNPEEIINIEDIDYLIGLTSASSDSAVISVKTCSSDEIIEVANPTPVVNNTNTTNFTTQNNTNTTNTTNTTIQQNETDAETVTTGNNNSLYTKWYFYIPAILIVIILGFIIRSYFKNKNSQPSTITQN